MYKEIWEASIEMTLSCEKNFTDSWMSCNLLNPRKIPAIRYLPMKDTSQAPRIDSPIVLIHFPPLKSGQPLYSGQVSWSQCVLCEEVPLSLISFLAFIFKPILHKSPKITHKTVVNVRKYRKVGEGE